MSNWNITDANGRSMVASMFADGQGTFYFACHQCTFQSANPNLIEAHVNEVHAMGASAPSTPTLPRTSPGRVMMPNVSVTQTLPSTSTVSGTTPNVLTMWRRATTTHNPRTYCATCDQTFATPNTLNRHKMSNKHQENLPKKSSSATNPIKPRSIYEALDEPLNEIERKPNVLTASRKFLVKPIQADPTDSEVKVESVDATLGQQQH